MTEQLALVEIPASPKLTDRQRAVLDALTAAGAFGVDADQAGAIAHELKTGRWRHSRDDRCEYCGRDGNQILSRLRDLGYARYRRRKGQLAGVWLATSERDETPPAPTPGGMLPDTQALPF